jgi:hypothetical protein
VGALEAEGFGGAADVGAVEFLENVVASVELIPG